MLSELSIKNIALIDKLRVEFGPGLNVLTGETGAGKSIVVDSVNLALGARSNRELIRTGAESASVSAVFELRSGRERIDALLDGLGIESEGDALTVSREVSAAGRSVCRVNGDVVPLGKFREITALLVDVHGQHEHQALLRAELHLDYLDSYGDEQHRQLIERVALCHQAYAETSREIERLNMGALERERRIDMLTHQIADIEAVKPKLGEDEKLEQKNNLLKNAEKISSGVSQAYQLVYKGEKGHSAQDALKRAAEAMKGISDIDERFAGLASRLEELFFAVQDAGYELQDIQEGIEYDPEQSQKIDDRLNELRVLKKKYGPDLADVMRFLEQAKAELEEIGEGDDRVSALKREQEKQRAALVQACDELTASRKRIAKGFSGRLLEQLYDLGMGKTRFEVGFGKAEPGAAGADKVEFMISPNPGEPLKPLAAIASGGELARIMLAMKAIAADSAGVDTMIFDEIDTGVSGRMAQVVGEKMAEVARKRQVICVTHLPQIAALADSHFLVEKTVADGRTGSGVRMLDESGRVEELARILGGAGSAESGLAYAREMLSAAQKIASRNS